MSYYSSKSRMARGPLSKRRKLAAAAAPDAAQSSSSQLALLRSELALRKAALGDTHPASVAIAQRIAEVENEAAKAVAAAKAALEAAAEARRVAAETKSKARAVALHTPRSVVVTPAESDDRTDDDSSSSSEEDEDEEGEGSSCNSSHSSSRSLNRSGSSGTLASAWPGGPKVYKRKSSGSSQNSDEAQSPDAEQVEEEEGELSCQKTHGDGCSTDSEAAASQQAPDEEEENSAPLDNVMGPHITPQQSSPSELLHPELQRQADYFKALDEGGFQFGFAQ